jgi:plasmid stability protein
MSTLVVKNLPEPLHEKLREQAQQNRRSVTQEAIHILERGLHAASHREPIRLPPTIKLKGGPLSTEWIEAAINEGRE